MEEHPVPQNVLEIEFKLFGGFSIRQFTKILLGCFVALGVFALNIHPLVSIPVIAISLGYGIGSAMIPGFDAKANTIINALFISPRYVWKRNAKTPDFMRDLQQSPGVSKDQKIAAASKKINVNELELDELIKQSAARRSNVAVPPDAPNMMKDSASPVPAQDDFSEWHPTAAASKSFATTYEQIYAAEAEASVKKPAAAQVSPTKSIPITTVEQVTTRIAPKPDTRPAKVGANLLGLVIDASGVPCPGVEVSIFDQKGKLIEKAISAIDGRFQGKESLPWGEYSVALKSPNLRFDTYKITVAEGMAPAFRFRAM